MTTVKDMRGPVYDDSMGTRIGDDNTDWLEAPQPETFWKKASATNKVALPIHCPRSLVVERRDKEPDLEAQLNQLGAEEDKKASAEVPRSPDGI
ncbi:uncharacterized protein B0T23DRAFT_400565 [Neurospora hispaniola]|uniref:Uncharacterized protein n=1 Tax=Neurospora hispaniola TaxID=588809 RepID=A0AAJ0MUM9_9PEZI|nr:hypothetical protein B0T23DRAFT_400565 [Neurospora hispaniola]